MQKSDTFNICFVCLGNICRSPLAQGVFERLVKSEGLQDKILVSSAGTGDWHVGDPPDRRMNETASKKGIPLKNRAKQFQAVDFDRFDLVLAMDRHNKIDLEKLCSPSAAENQLKLFRSFDDEANGELEVPDPYYGGQGGFENVFQIVQRTCPNILDFAKARLNHSK